MQINNNLQDKHILIVGASQGIGAETAKECARRGASLSLAARSEKVLEIADQLVQAERHGGYCFDVADIEQIDQFVGEVVKKKGRPLDGMVYCVGPQCVRPLRMLDPEVVKKTMTIGFGAYIEMVRAAVKKGNYNQPMSIVSVSSIVSQAGSPGKTVYGAMKAAMDAAVRSLAVELAPKGIRLNTVRPGLVATERLEKLQELVGDAGQLKAIEARQYMGISETADMAKTICFLLSEDAKAITGTNMDVSGGFLTS